MTDSLSTDRPWRQVLRAAKAARGASFLGQRAAAYAAAAEVASASQGTRIAVACILAAQAAKNEFLTDLSTFWRELETRDAFRLEMSQSQHVGRYVLPAPRAHDPLPVEAAKAVPILELFARYGHQLRRAGVEWKTRCPFHDDGRPSLRVNAAKGRWYCDVCATGGDGISYVMQRKGLDFAQAVREVAA